MSPALAGGFPTTAPPGKPKLYFYLFFFYFIFLIYLFYLFIFGCVGSSLLRKGFSSCDEHGLLLVAVRGLLIAVASLVVEHGL